MRLIPDAFLLDEDFQDKLLRAMRSVFPERSTYAPDASSVNLAAQLADLERRELCDSGLLTKSYGTAIWRGALITPGGLAYLEGQDRLAKGRLH